jgi:hypothetical protein
MQLMLDVDLELGAWQKISRNATQAQCTHLSPRVKRASVPIEARAAIFAFHLLLVLVG